MKVQFLADENVDSDVVLGLKRRVAHIDIVRVQDVGLRTENDLTILQWAAEPRNRHGHPYSSSTYDDPSRRKSWSSRS